MRRKAARFILHFSFAAATAPHHGRFMRRKAARFILHFSFAAHRAALRLSRIAISKIAS